MHFLFLSILFKFLFSIYDFYQEYKWKIGATPGGSELQDFISTGIYPTGINDTLEGVLEHNTTYYVTVICTNGGGESITTVDHRGGYHLDRLGNVYQW